MSREQLDTPQPRPQLTEAMAGFAAAFNRESVAAIETACDESQRRSEQRRRRNRGRTAIVEDVLFGVLILVVVGWTLVLLYILAKSLS